MLKRGISIAKILRDVGLIKEKEFAELITTARSDETAEKLKEEGYTHDVFKFNKKFERI